MDYFCVSDQYERSIDVCQQALKHLPGEPQLYFNMANAYGKMNKYEDSARMFDKAIQLAPDRAQYYANYGERSRLILDV